MKTCASPSDDLLRRLAYERWIADPHIKQRITSAIPLGRVAEPAEVAEAALWLCSDAAAYLTGVTLPVDGGFVIA